MKNLTKYLYIIFFLTSTIHIYAQTVRIMPLGDSITHGYPSGYRNYLWYKLQDAKYDVDFVGSQNDGYLVTPHFDSDHEGYGGYKTYEIADIVYRLLEDNQPDIILLHIGSNDVSPTQGIDSSSVAGLEDILNQIDYYEKDYNHPIKIILASIINRQEYHQTVTDFNINLRSMANKRISNGDLITLVNMEDDAGLITSDFGDATHPNDSGYYKMANVWFPTLTDILNSIIIHPRMMADVNGDGMADAIGFTEKGVSVALSNGSSFDSTSLWIENFGYNQGWETDKSLRKMIDVNGDGMDDIVGFGNNGVSVALSNGSGFDPASLWLNDFGYNQGWRKNSSLRILADVNGDGKADIVGFGNNGVSVALSDGNSFVNAQRWVNDFGYNQGWRNDKGLRFMSDVNGDGKADIVGFGNNGVSVALSDGNSFINAARWVNDFGYNQGWENIKHIRLTADINGDGSKDIIGFGNTGISVSKSSGINFSNASLWLNDFGYNQGWKVDFTPYQEQQ